MYPDPDEQAKAIAIFGGMGGIGIGMTIRLLFLGALIANLLTT